MHILTIAYGKGGAEGSPDTINSAITSAQTENIRAFSCFSPKGSNFPIIPVIPKPKKAVDDFINKTSIDFSETTVKTNHKNFRSISKADLRLGTGLNTLNPFLKEPIFRTTDTPFKEETQLVAKISIISGGRYPVLSRITYGTTKKYRSKSSTRPDFDESYASAETKERKTQSMKGFFKNRDLNTSDMRDITKSRNIKINKENTLLKTVKAG